jgi:hypothetical protein
MVEVPKLFFFDTWLIGIFSREVAWGLGGSAFRRSWKLRGPAIASSKLLSDTAYSWLPDSSANPSNTESAKATPRTVSRVRPPQYSINPSCAR